MPAPASLLILLTGFLFDDVLAAFADPNDSRVFLGPITVKASAKPCDVNDLHVYDDSENCDGGVDDGG